jgi:hypothetical protein
MKSYISDPTKNGSDSKIIHDASQYIVQEGRLFKINRLKPRLYVPQSLRKEVIEMCYNSKFAGHDGILATEARINQDFLRRRILKDVTDYVKKCSSCQLNKRGMPQRVPTGKVGLQEGTQLPFHTLNFDIKGPLPRMKGRNLYIISFFDPSTHWVEAYRRKKRTLV